MMLGILGPPMLIFVKTGLDDLALMPLIEVNGAPA
jgi:hypothetical protein